MDPPRRTKMSNLPKDLEEEVLSRVPVTSIRKLRFTCKKWNSVSKGKNFAKKHLVQATSKKFMVVIMMEYRIYLMSLNLYENVESCIKQEGKLISLDDSYEVDLSKVYHCNGLLLCITKYHTKFVVWNPYWGQTRCIEPTLAFHRLDGYSYAIGYDRSSQCYKILTFIDWYFKTTFVEIKIYDLNSNSWRVLDIPLEGQIEFYYHGVSLKGDTYWFATDRPTTREAGFLVCFDFTKERFGPLLPLPFQWYPEDTVTLSSVREEKLAVLFQRWDTLMIEIWITTEIKPNSVSWSSKVFLAVDISPLSGYQFNLMATSFFIDEEKKVIVVFSKKPEDPTHNEAYIVGVDGSLKIVCLEECRAEDCFPLACTYVPSLVQLN